MGGKPALLFPIGRPNSTFMGWSMRKGKERPVLRMPVFGNRVGDDAKGL
jgi:hypothetical protein